ncbi:MAG: hypothetical protein ACOCTR_01825 [Candidatus Natronoplasma sp.]
MSSPKLKKKAVKKEKKWFLIGYLISPHHYIQLVSVFVTRVSGSSFFESFIFHHFSHDHSNAAGVFISFLKIKIDKCNVDVKKFNPGVGKVYWIVFCRKCKETVEGVGSVEPSKQEVKQTRTYEQGV